MPRRQFCHAAAIDAPCAAARSSPVPVGKPLGPQEGPNGFGVSYPALYPVRGSPGLSGDLLGGTEVGEGSPVDGDAVGVADGGRGSGGLGGEGFRLLRPRMNHRAERPKTAWKMDAEASSPHRHSPQPDVISPRQQIAPPTQPVELISSKLLRSFLSPKTNSLDHYGDSDTFNVMISSSGSASGICT